MNVVEHNKTFRIHYTETKTLLFNYGNIAIFIQDLYCGRSDSKSKSTSVITSPIRNLHAQTSVAAPIYEFPSGACRIRMSERDWIGNYESKEGIGCREG